MRKNLKSIIGTLIIAVSALTIIFGTNAMASNDNISFKFEIKSWWGNSRSVGRYRQTKSPENPWKVQMVTSGEGKGTITLYWIEGSDGTDVSPTIEVVPGDYASYTRAYGSASERTVYLTAQNNNFSSNIYTVSGYWDEETW